MDILELLREVEEKGASDLIIKVGSPPLFRISGELVPSKKEKLLSEDTLEIAKRITNERQWQTFEKEKELDFAYAASEKSRFRVNFFQQRGTVGLAFRIIPDKIPTIEKLGIPEICKELVLRPRGLILVTGPAGCGKSTTLAALIDHRNQEEDSHIMTIEDPIEFVHRDKKGLVNQRQVGRDTLSFANGLKYVLRQDPDVILIGEMRDLETISLAITAAETGHLALGTLHTSNASQTIDRVINVFPSHQQHQVKMQLSVNLVAIISQILLRRADGVGRIAVFEILIATPAIRNLIREGKTFQIPQILETSNERGMISMERYLANLVQKRIVTLDEALAKAPKPEELQNLLGSEPLSRKVFTRE